MNVRFRREYCRKGHHDHAATSIAGCSHDSSLSSGTFYYTSSLAGGKQHQLPPRQHDFLTQRAHTHTHDHRQRRQPHGDALPSCHVSRRFSPRRQGAQGKRRHTHNGSTSWCKREVGEKRKRSACAADWAGQKTPTFFAQSAVFLMECHSPPSLGKMRHGERHGERGDIHQKDRRRGPARRQALHAAPERLRKRGLNSTAHAPFSWG